MQNKKSECIDEIELLLEEIKSLCNKNTHSTKNLKKYNIPHIETKISEIQQESARYISICLLDLKKLPLNKLEKIKNKFLNHIDKLLNQDLYLQQLSSKCSFLQENCMLKEEFSDDNNEEENDKSESLTVLMRNSNANISKISIEDHNLSDNEDLAKEFPEEINGKKLKIDYDNLLNEHIKALETIKELKRKLVQKYEEKNFLKNPPPTKNNNITFQEQKENLKSFSSTSIQNNLRMNNDKNSKHIKTQSQSYNSNFISNNYYPVCPNFNKKELWNYIFRLQNYLLEEIEFHDRQKQSFFLEIEQKNILLKQLMKEKADYDSYKGYSSLGNYMDIMEPYEILEIMKGAKELKSSFNMKKRMEESQKANNEKLEKIMIEMNNLEEENNFLKSELDTTRNESFIFKQYHESDKEKNEKMIILEKEKIEIQRNLLEIEQNKIKNEKNELLKLRELAKLSEGRGVYVRK